MMSAETATAVATGINVQQSSIWTAEDDDELQLLLSPSEFDQLPTEGSTWTPKDDKDLQELLGQMGMVSPLRAQAVPAITAPRPCGGTAHKKRPKNPRQDQNGAPGYCFSVFVALLFSDEDRALKTPHSGLV